jgi:hypothetical protein
VSAEGLASLDTFSASDSMAVLYERGPRALVEVGRTEIIGACRGRAWLGARATRHALFTCTHAPSRERGWIFACIWARVVVCARVCGSAPANSNSPKFVKLIRAKYKFEEVQNLVLRLYDIDSSLHSRTDQFDLASQDFIGEISCQFAQVRGGGA